MPTGRSVQRGEASVKRQIMNLLVVAAALAATVSHAAGRPNVLFIAIDDLNHWVGHLGRNPQPRTPAIDRLATPEIGRAHV